MAMKTTTQEDYKKLVASRIKGSRHAAGIASAEKAAAMVGEGRSAWLNWECGARLPQPWKFFKIAQVLGVDPGYLLGTTNNPGGQPDDWSYITANHANIAQLRGSKDKQLVSDSVAFHSQDLDERELAGHKILLLRASDDSMAPDLRQGDDVLIDLTSTVVTTPDIYAIADKDNNIWFRWIRRELNGGYTLYANDKNHSNDQHLSEDEFSELNVLGRYTWAGRWRNQA